MPEPCGRCLRGFVVSRLELAMGRLKAGQVLADLPDSYLWALLSWHEMTGESGRWVAVHQEITTRQEAAGASRNTSAPDQHIDAKKESSTGNCSTGKSAPSGHRAC